jgi:hypothetical protein
MAVRSGCPAVVQGRSVAAKLPVARHHAPVASHAREFSKVRDRLILVHFLCTGTPIKKVHS